MRKTNHIPPNTQVQFENSTNSRTVQATTELNAGDWPTIGIYQAKAGTRNASGVTIFVRKIFDRLATLNSAYLYTEDSTFTNKIENPDAEVVSFRQHTDGQRIYERIPDFAINSRLLSTEVSEKIISFMNAVQDGVIEHINQNVDVLLTHNIVDTALLSNVVTVPVIRVFHCCQKAGIGSKLLKILSQTATTIANSQQTAREVSEQLGYNPVGIVHPGVDIEMFTPDRTPAFERDDPVVMFVGRFVRKKGVLDLIDAFAEIAVDAHLYLVGRGDVTKLKNRIGEYKIENSVTIEGPVSHSKLPGYYTAADIVCLPSYYESFGMVNLEAMASGTAVITSDLDGIREYATDQETCLLVPPGDTNRLTNSLDELVSSPELRANLGEAGREVAKQYSWRKSAEKLQRICNDSFITNE